MHPATAGEGFPSVNDILDWYLAHEVREFSPVALKERQRIWNLFRKQYGSREVADCKPYFLLDFITSQKGARSNWTRRRIKATICTPFNVAAQVGLIQRNPFAGVKMPEGPCGRDWTDEEFKAIIRYAAPYFRRMILFIRFAGARPGEARTLEWIHVRDEAEAIVQDQHKTAHITKEPRRIHFNRAIIRLLAFEKSKNRNARFVFVNRKGCPWTIQAMTKNFRGVRKRAGLRRDVKLHGGRHTFATNAILNDVDLATLAQLLGHTSLASTKRYLHLIDKRKHLNAAMEKAVRRRVS